MAENILLLKQRTAHYLERKSYVCLHMNVIPGDTVLSAGGDTAPHGKHQPLGPGQVDTVQGLLPLRGV